MGCSICPTCKECGDCVPYIATLCLSCRIARMGATAPAEADGVTKRGTVTRIGDENCHSGPRGGTPPEGEAAGTPLATSPGMAHETTLQAKADAAGWIVAIITALDDLGRDIWMYEELDEEAREFLSLWLNDIIENVTDGDSLEE